MSINKDMKLYVDGMGIVIYSNMAMKNVNEGEDFFKNEFFTPESVAQHIKKGDITGFCTGTGGQFNLKIREGYPDNETEKQFPVSIRLAIDVRGNIVSIIDLAWLTEWSNDVPEMQQIIVEEGIYHLTILTCKPKSGIWGDDQDIYIYFNRLKNMPELSWDGVPQLFF